MQYNALQSLQAFEMGQGQRKQREQEAGRVKLGNALAGGDYAGGASMAYGMGDIETGMALQGQQKSMLDAEGEKRRNAMMAASMALLKRTEGPDRQAFVPQVLETMRLAGIELPPEALSQMDLSTKAIEDTLTALQDPESLMKQYQAQMNPEFFAPTEILGPDGKPTMAQFSKSGMAPRTFDGAAPYQAPDQRPWWAIEGGGVDPAQLANQAAGRSPGVNINLPGEGPQETAFMREAGSLEAKNFGSLVEMGQTSRRNRVILDQLDTEAAAIPGGLEAVAKNALGNLGIPVEGLSEIQATEALINQLVPAQRQPGSGPMSDRDLALFKASLPRLIQTAEGKTRILSNMKAINDYVISEGEIASRVLSGRITPEQGRAEMQALGNPLAGDPRTGKPTGPQGADLQGLMAPDGDPVTEEDVAETMRKYNVSREQVIAHLRGQ